jgi:hypothetical protein
MAYLNTGLENQSYGQLPETELDAVRSAFSQVHSLCSAVNALVEKLCGATPTSDSANAQKLSAGGILPDLGSRAASASLEMDNALRALQRLEGRL